MSVSQIEPNSVKGLREIIAKKLAGGLQGEIEREILEKKGLKQEDFRNAHIIRVEILGGLRAALAKMIGFSFEISEDKIKPLKSSVKFSLHIA